MRITFLAALVLCGCCIAGVVSAQSVYSDRLTLNAGPCTESSGSGSPEGAKVGVVCDTYHQSDSPYDIWRKTSGSGNTGWVKITTGGTVTSVDITGPSLVNWTNRPITVSGTLTGAWTTATAGKIVRSTGSDAAWSTTIWPNSATLGDILVATGTNTFGSLPDVAVGSVLASAGVGTAVGYTASPSLTSIGGALDLTLNPSSSLVTNPASNLVLPALNYTTNIGQLNLKYLTLYAAELWVETLVAQNTIATIGGRVLVAPTNILTDDLAPAGTVVQVKYNNFNLGDRVYMEAAGKVEFMNVIGGGSGSAGAYFYSVTRNVDGSGANQWYAGDAILDTGTTGNGFIDLYSTAGVFSGSGPTIVGNVRTGTAYNAVSPRWAIGNLNGLYSYGADTYGAVFGDAANTNVTVDATNGFRIRSGTTNKFAADISGNLSLTGDLTMTTAGVFHAGATAFATGVGWWMDYNSGTPRFRIGNPSGNQLAWDGTNLSVTGAVTAASGVIGGWTISSNALYNDTGVDATSAGMVPGDFPFYAGHQSATRSTAPFRVTSAGAVTMSSGSIGLGAVTINSSGVSLTTPTSYADTNAFRFSALSPVTGSQFGLYGQQTGSGVGSWRFLTLQNVVTSDHLTTTRMAATNTSATAYMELTALPTGSGGAGVITVGPQFHVVGPAVIDSNINALGSITLTGGILPPIDNNGQVGNNSTRFNLVRAVTITSGDVNFENGWAFTESYKVGIDQPGIAIVDDAGKLIAFFGEASAYSKAWSDVDDLPYALTTQDQRNSYDATPGQRVKGYDAAGAAMYKTSKDVPQPPAERLSNNEREKGK